MLPCQISCSGYRDGCHKTCSRWKAFQESQRSQRQAKKDYLKFYNELCISLARQYGAMGTCRPYR